METTTKKCPMCAEVIPLAAANCEYCGTQFEVTITGYCQNCHQIREADENGCCKVCNGEIIDRRVESKLVEEPIKETIPIHEPAIRKTNRKLLPRGILAGVVLISSIGAYLLLRRDDPPAAPVLIDTPTPIATFAPPPAAGPAIIQTTAPTHTLRPTSTATPIPTWVTNFAEPILAAIANKRPHFQDDFSQTSVSWRFVNDNYVEMDIEDGVLKMTSGQGGTGYTGYSASHPAMRFKNFALRVDIDLSKLGSGDAVGITWRGRDDYHDLVEFTLSNSGSWWIASSNPYSELASGRSSIRPIQKVTITIISRGTEYAIYINEAPVSYLNDSGRRLGVGITLYVYDNDLRSPTMVTFDNLTVWDLDKIQIQP